MLLFGENYEGGTRMTEFRVGDEVINTIGDKGEVLAIGVDMLFVRTKDCEERLWKKTHCCPTKERKVLIVVKGKVTKTVSRYCSWTDSTDVEICCQ